MSNDKNAQWHGGKGSYRRNENKEAYESNWDRIFGDSLPDVEVLEEIVEAEAEAQEEYVEECPLDRYMRHMDSIRSAQAASAPVCYTNMNDVPNES